MFTIINKTVTYKLSEKLPIKWCHEKFKANSIYRRRCLWQEIITDIQNRSKRWGRMIHMKIYTYILHILQNSFFCDKRQRVLQSNQRKIKLRKITLNIGCTGPNFKANVAITSLGKLILLSLHKTAMDKSLFLFFLLNWTSSQ